MKPSDLLTTRQTCQLLGITRQTLYAWIEQKKIKPWHKGGRSTWFFLRSEVKKAKGKKFRRG